jgi:hypothetical protein
VSVHKTFHREQFERYYLSDGVEAPPGALPIKGYKLAMDGRRLVP